MIKQRAFTLIELLLSLALVAILLLFSLPSTSFMNEKNQIEVIQNDIKAAVLFAKTQAVITGKNIILAPLHDSQDWSNGMQLMQADKLLQEWRWKSSGIHISWHGFQSSHYLLFSADISQNAVNGFFEIKNNTQRSFKLVINRLGRIRATLLQTT